MHSVVVPVHNEGPYLAAALIRFLDGMPAGLTVDEVILVENGSSDDTLAVCRAMSDRYRGVVRWIRLENRDYGGAVRKGLAAAGGNVITLIDADFLDHGFLAASLTELGRGADLVLGTKGSDDKRPLRRRLFSALYRFALRLASGFPGSDTRGMKTFRRDVGALALREARVGGDTFQTEIAVLAWRAGYRLSAVPLVIREVRPSRFKPGQQIVHAVTGLVRLAVIHRLGKRAA